MPDSRLANLIKNDDFVGLWFPIKLLPREGCRFWRLECQIDFTTKGQTAAPIIHDVSPAGEWSKLASLTLGLKAGISERLQFQLDLKGYPETNRL